ncbi:DNA modification system-associated small protein [Paenibacillus sp. FSL M8-0212]|uniref:DNA modification system-associated small protein n=1 Tax=Paenibacillus sp. FSL M8-0212 TaxID=2921618 RepID=UPI0030F7FA0F
MNRNEIEVEELLRALETIRDEQYPDIPAEIIREIVLTQFENQDDRTEARRNTVKLIDSYLKNINVIPE